MTGQELRSEYTRILEELLPKDANGGEFPGHELRAHPRLKVESSDLWISTVPEFALIDMSISGVAIHSNHPLKPGEILNISLGTILSAEAQVLGCKMEESPTEYSDGLFRIQCQFVEQLQGMELLVKTVRTHG